MRRGGAPCLQLSARRRQRQSLRSPVISSSEIVSRAFHCRQRTVPRTHKPSTPRERAETRATNGGLANACRFTAYTKC